MKAAKVDCMVLRTMLYVQRSFDAPYSVVVSFSWRMAHDKLLLLEVVSS